jgi:hypothetical protein
VVLLFLQREKKIVLLPLLGKEQNYFYFLYAYDFCPKMPKYMFVKDWVAALADVAGILFELSLYLYPAPY